MPKHIGKKAVAKSTTGKGRGQCGPAIVKPLPKKK